MREDCSGSVSAQCDDAWPVGNKAGCSANLPVCVRVIPCVLVSHQSHAQANAKITRGTATATHAPRECAIWIPPLAWHRQDPRRCCARCRVLDAAWGQRCDDDPSFIIIAYCTLLYRRTGLCCIHGATTLGRFGNRRAARLCCTDRAVTYWTPRGIRGARTQYGLQCLAAGSHMRSVVAGWHRTRTPCSTLAKIVKVSLRDTSTIFIWTTKFSQSRVRFFSTLLKKKQDKLPVCE